MFRVRNPKCPFHQPLQEIEKTTAKVVKGATKKVTEKVLDNPEIRINFDSYTLQDLIATGVKLEEVPTKIISSSFDDVPRETPKEETTEENPF